MKIILISSFAFACIACGFILGRSSANKPSKVETVSKSASVEHAVATVSTQAEVKKDSTTAKQTIIVKKNYSNAGKLQVETITHVNYLNSEAQEKKMGQIRSSGLTRLNEISQVKPLDLTKANWEFGFMAPMLDYKKPNIDFGYRIFGDFYLHSEVNVFERTGSIGFFILM